jgi:hypothetical protein
MSGAPVVRLCLQTRTRGHLIAVEAAEMVEQLNQNQHSRPIYGCSLGQFMSAVTAEETKTIRRPIAVRLEK